MAADIFYGRRQISNRHYFHVIYRREEKTVSSEDSYKEDYKRKVFLSQLILKLKLRNYNILKPRYDHGSVRVCVRRMCISQCVNNNRRQQTHLQVYTTIT